MDFRKGKSWAGNIYQQFESICQDVDDFMNKDTMKFVENQVQNVGVSVKRFCSNVVQDILPLSGDITISKSKLVDEEQVDTWDHEDSVKDLMTEPAQVNENHLSIKHISIATTGNSDVALPIELGHGMQLTRNLDTELSQEEEIQVNSREDGDGIVSNNVDKCSEENNTEGLMLLNIKSSSQNDRLSESAPGELHNNSMLVADSLPVPSAPHETGTSSEDHKDLTLNMDSSPAFFIHEAGLSTIKKETILYDSYLDVPAGPSNISASECAFGSKLPMGENPNPDVDRVLSELSETSADRVYECMASHSSLPSSTDAIDIILSNSDVKRSISSSSVTSVDKLPELKYVTMHLPLPSTRNAADRASGTVGTILCDSFSTKDESFHAASLVQSSESMFSSDEEERTGVNLNSASTSPKPYNILEYISSRFMKDVEVICHSPAGPDHCAYNFPTLSKAAACETKAADPFPALSISDSKSNVSGLCTSTLAENNAFKTNAFNFVEGSSEDKHKQAGQCGESKFLMPSSEIPGSAQEFDIEAPDLDMETIDLSSDVKHDEENVVQNGMFAHSTVSHRRRNFRYYKKLIQDAFTSQKRLSKEYEHLAILYSDIDKESSQFFRSSSAPTSPDKYVHPTGAQTSQEMCDTEWELL